MAQIKVWIYVERDICIPILFTLARIARITVQLSRSNYQLLNIIKLIIRSGREACEFKLEFKMQNFIISLS